MFDCKRAAVVRQKATKSSKALLNFSSNLWQTIDTALVEKLAQIETIGGVEKTLITNITTTF
jgi:hypothetical protein